MMQYLKFLKSPLLKLIRQYQYNNNNNHKAITEIIDNYLDYLDDKNDDIKAVYNGYNVIVTPDPKPPYLQHHTLNTYNCTKQF